MDQTNNLKDFFSIDKRTKYFVHVLALLCLSAAIIFALLIIGEVALSRGNKKVKIKPNPFENISLEGKGAVVFDVINNKELFSKNPDMPLPLASLTKVMTAVTADGKLDVNQNIKITPDDLGPEGDSKLVVGDTWKAGDLRDFTLITSSNDGAFALAAVAEANGDRLPPKILATDKQSLIDQFVKDMNYTAAAIGLSNSKFFNEHGLDMASDKGGAYGSARDMVTLFEYAIKNYPDLLEATRYKTLEFNSAEKTYTAENTNAYIDKIPNVIASKTGFTDLAGGNLVVAFDAGLGRPIIISVLGSTEEGRFTDVLQLTKASIKYINDN